MFKFSHANFKIGPMASNLRIRKNVRSFIKTLANSYNYTENINFGGSCRLIGNMSEIFDFKERQFLSTDFESFGSPFKWFK